MKKLYSVNTKLCNVTGVQKVLMDIHHAVQGEFDALIVGTVPYEQVHEDLNIRKEEYVKLSSPFMFRNGIVVVHERKLLLLFWILNVFFFQQIKIVYIHHNEFHNLRMLTVLPKTIVAISDNGIKNLVEYFGAKRGSIRKIYNCVVDHHPSKHAPNHKNNVVILLPARVNAQKQQLEIVRNLRGKIDKHVKIKFAGIGPQYEELQSIVNEGDSEFEILGYRSDIISLFESVDYVMLFSKHEGLPVTLIEATMMGVPIICSNVGGNAEICHNGENGFVVDDWNELIDTINRLPFIGDDEYEMMSRNSRKIYEQHFTFDKFQKEYIDLFRSI